MTTRSLRQVITALDTSDGAGVRLRRSIGARPGLRLDPFLMLDEFGTENPDDYIAGFPPHPHRGFETVTYMIDGHMLHQDHMGNRGDLRNGDVQWMTAGRGIIHSEMPQQTEGRMRGFQLWINLPAKEKMKPAHYRDIPSSQIPVVPLPSGGQVKVIAGSVIVDGKTTTGPISGLSTDPLYLDIALQKGEVFVQPLPAGHNAFAYIYEGNVRVGAEGSEQALPHRASGVLGPGDSARFVAEADGTRLILLAGKPINEPIAQYGPFVMNFHDEIEQAIRDYSEGRLATA